MVVCKSIFTYSGEESGVRLTSSEAEGAEKENNDMTSLLGYFYIQSLFVIRNPES